MDTKTTTDYLSQAITLMTPMGPTDISVKDIDAFYDYNVQAGINYGAQAGASIVLLVALLVLTKAEKRRSSIFIVNGISLVLNNIRTILHCVYFPSAWLEFYAYFAQDYSRISRSAYATSATTTVFEPLVLIAIQVSLCMQTRVVCVTLRELHQRLILGSSVLVALMAIAFKMVYMIENCIYIIQAKQEDALYWIGSATNITTSISICWFCIIFLTKLGFALHARRKLGMVQFGPMQIIFIMGCQTLIIPALFAILQYVCNTPLMYSNTLTAVVVFLPLSSLWAAASLDHQFEDAREARCRRENRQGSNETKSTEGAKRRGLFGTSSSRAETLAPSNKSPLSPGARNLMMEDKVHLDLEAQGLEEKENYKFEK